MKKLTSPHVVKMYDALETTNNAYIILELCNGGDLSKFIRKHDGLLEEKLAIEVLSQLMKGFKNLVNLGYIHR